METRSLITAALLLFVINFTNAQQSKTQDYLSSRIEDFISAGFDESIVQEFSNDIDQLLDNPVKLNSKDRDELARLFFLTSFQIESLLDYTLKNGPFISLFEVSLITGFDRELAELIKPFISLDIKSNSGAVKYNRTNINSIFTYSSRDTGSFPGPGFKFATRLGHEAGRFKMGFIYEKDKGESFLYNKYIPEYISGYLEYNGAGIIRRIILGDYRVRYGQGLTVWQGFSPGSSPLNSNPVRGSSRVRPYASSDENNFFRGIAISGNKNNLSFSVYASSNKIDATVYVDSLPYPVVRSLYDAGTHITEAELNKRNALTEYSAGGNLNLNLKKINIGTSITGTYFSSPFKPPDIIENIYDYSGQSNITFSIDHTLSLDKIYVYGESAINQTGKMASLQGIRLIPVERVILNLLWSRVSKGYTSFHGQVSGKETANKFRNSYMANIALDIGPGFDLKVGILKHKDLWYGYQSALFPQSVKYMSELEYKPLENISVKLSAWRKESLKDVSVETGIDHYLNSSTNSIRLHLRSNVTESLLINARVEANNQPISSETGLLVYQSFSFRPRAIPLNFILRIYTYSTDSYNTRIYAWEDDLLYSSSIPALYGKGSRVYCLVKYQISDRTSLIFKTGFTDTKRDESQLTFYEYKFQLRIRI